jgi:hypothetical protein
VSWEGWSTFISQVKLVPCRISPVKYVSIVAACHIHKKLAPSSWLPRLPYSSEHVGILVDEMPLLKVCIPQKINYLFILTTYSMHFWTYSMYIFGLFIPKCSSYLFHQRAPGLRLTGYGCRNFVKFLASRSPIPGAVRRGSLKLLNLQVPILS